VDPRRSLPSVSALLELNEVSELLATVPRTLVVAAARDALDQARDDASSAPRGDQAWSASVIGALHRRTTPSLRRVINGTGVLLHTNLGRAPLAEAAVEAIRDVAVGYSNLEYDLETGARGSRYVHCASILCELTGAEDALVVNNNAAAVVLAVNTLAAGRRCLISRGELVEIGGSFRVPEIMERSGAQLAEIGTTNRTHLEDYRAAIAEDTGAIVKVHRSNFAMEGFVAEVEARALADLAEEHGLPFIHDLGSGLLLALDQYGLRGEPTAGDALRAGAHVVTMSGDKLLGGPQAGFILGKRERIAAIRKNPLTRSYRVDKLTLAALEATLSIYRDPVRARREIPILVQLGSSIEELRSRATEIAARIGNGGADRVTVVDSTASVGGGAFPTTALPSIALRIDRGRGVEATLRAGDPPIVGRVQDDALLLDLRTIFPREDDTVAGALRNALAG
jgi:L-seryl-tRNA(Ser) seleniumtransferase